MNYMVLGAFRGDEGKGKVVDYFTNNIKLAIRFNGSCNAGHTLVRNGKELVLHQIPSAIISGIQCIIAHGCLVNVKKLINEINMIEEWEKEGLINLGGKSVKDLLKIANGCHIITEEHIKLDNERENTGKGNGSTRQGISPAYSDKFLRSGKRIIDDEYSRNLLKDMLIDDITYLNSIKLDNILFEGAQGIMLDIDSAYYPNVSSSSVGFGGMLIGTGINPLNLSKVPFKLIGVVKAYMTSVGDGFFPTKISEDNSLYDLNALRQCSGEFGATTKRPRKIGFFDIPMINYAIHISGINSICLTRLDTVRKMFKKYKQFPICTSYIDKITNNIVNYKDISIYNLQNYKPQYEMFNVWEKEELTDNNYLTFINFLRDNLLANIEFISVGPGKNDIIQYVY